MSNDAPAVQTDVLVVGSGPGGAGAALFLATYGTQTMVITRYGHLSDTPDAGDAGIAVYAAHRDTHFAFLGGVAPGDAIVVTRRDGTVARFRVTGTGVVRWDASGIDPGAPGRRLALVTCWPLDAVLPGPLRYVVYADLEGR